MSEVEELEFPIRRIVYDVERDASVFYLGQPITLEPISTPLRRGQIIAVQDAPYHIRVAEIAEVGEGFVTLWEWSDGGRNVTWNMRDFEEVPSPRLTRLAPDE